MSIWQRYTQLVHRFTCRQEHIQVSMQACMHIHHAVDLTISGTILGCIYKAPVFLDFAIVYLLATSAPTGPRPSGRGMRFGLCASSLPQFGGV